MFTAVANLGACSQPSRKRLTQKAAQYCHLSAESILWFLLDNEYGYRANVQRPSILVLKTGKKVFQPQSALIFTTKSQFVLTSPPRNGRWTGAWGGGSSQRYSSQKKQQYKGAVGGNAENATFGAGARSRQRDEEIACLNLRARDHMDL